MALAILCILVHENSWIPKHDKRLFYLTYAIIAVSAFAEWIGVRLSGNAEVPVWLLKGIKCLDYILTPLTGLAIVAQMKLRNSLFNVMLALLGGNAVFQLIACFNDWMTVVDDNHRYTHGTLYGVYMAVYLAIILLTAIEFLMFSLSYRKRNRTALISVFVLLLAGIVLQESFGGECRTAYIAMTFGVALMFINYAEFYKMAADEQLMKDALCDVYSRYAYNKDMQRYSRIDKLPDNFTVFVFDINGLKAVNDTYGHDEGDELIVSAARCIEKAVGDFGRCYRVGGDEFTVVTNMKKEETKEVLSRLEEESNLWSEKKSSYPLSIAPGYARSEDYPDLTDAEEAIEKLTADKAAADDVAEQISSLPEEITLDDKTDVEAARAAYDALTDDQKAFVDDETVEKLTDAETAIADLEAAAEVTEQINNLPEEITLDDKDDVEAARAAYDALTDDQKALVDEDTVTALTDAETAIADLEAAAAVTEQIEALPETITVDDKDDVEAARAAYDALTDDQKALVDDETVTALTEAEDALAAAQVTETINALPTEITDDDIDDVIDASIAYEALTDNQKAKIDSETLKKLVSAANAVVKILGDKKEAENVANLINALPEKITSADKEAVEAARAAYDALSDDQKAYVDEDTVKKLTDAEEALNTPVLLGDVDGDGEVTSLDATLIQRQIAFMDVKDFNETAADVDGDGEVTSLDATYIQRYLAFMDVKFPIEQPI